MIKGIAQSAQPVDRTDDMRVVVPGVLGVDVDIGVVGHGFRGLIDVLILALDRISWRSLSVRRAINLLGPGSRKWRATSSCPHKEAILNRNGREKRR